jgi:hypothetical protein
LIDKISDLSGMFFGAGTRELAHEGLCHKKNDRALALSLSFAKVIPAVKTVMAV